MTSPTPGKVTTASTQTLQENLEIEHAYVTFKTAIGQFQIGYQNVDEWGTVFGDTPGSRPRVAVDRGLRSPDPDRHL